MKSAGRQRDLIRESPAALIAAHRAAAEAARSNPYENEAEREARARHHEAEAQAIERAHAAGLRGIATDTSSATQAERARRNRGATPWRTYPMVDSVSAKLASMRYRKKAKQTRQPEP